MKSWYEINLSNRARFNDHKSLPLVNEYTGNSNIFITNENIQQLKHEEYLRFKRYMEDQLNPQQSEMFINAKQFAGETDEYNNIIQKRNAIMSRYNPEKMSEMECIVFLSYWHRYFCKRIDIMIKTLEIDKD